MATILPNFNSFMANFIDYSSGSLPVKLELFSGWVAWWFWGDNMVVFAATECSFLLTFANKLLINQISLFRREKPCIFMCNSTIFVLPLTFITTFHGSK